VTFFKKKSSKHLIFDNRALFYSIGNDFLPSQVEVNEVANIIGHPLHFHPSALDQSLNPLMDLHETHTLSILLINRDPGQAYFATAWPRPELNPDHPFG
jgi:hypothetical protein